ncbi:cupin domain-containing protein [Streptomyces sp. XM4193]|uniref:cupin domain-containing protein n=1 Tax=Streptomyces sp. XM4193 TaxID=2929782 RepID=UPI001FFBE1FE|nr:cupin domain-containing protein [Streptomyces sp. XM4193]MCK1797606.1 cupin domain-containing protein [Streptomyces sp. XM4193]
MTADPETDDPGTALPGGIGLSRLRVYDWPAPPGADGLCGGTPHMHLACTEAYAVVGGRGAVQTLTTGGFASTPLREGDLVWFTPGTVHRLVNDGGLRILVLMQNSGLPEAGDAVFTFPSEVLADPDAYARAAALGREDPAHDARNRRDLALTGFTELRRRLDAEDPAALPDFHDAALRIVRDRLPDWRARFAEGPAAEVSRTAAHLDALAAGDTSHLRSAAVHRGDPAPAWGMCGRLDKYSREGTTRIV